MPTPQLIEDLAREEGCELSAYLDTHGVPTIGYGHTGREVHLGLTWSPGQALAALGADLAATDHGLDTAVPWWRKLSQVRQDVLTNMAFNIGVHGLTEFTSMLENTKAGRFTQAAAAMLASDWAKPTDQGGVGARAIYLAQMMRTGKRS